MTDLLEALKSRAAPRIKDGGAFAQAPPGLVTLSGETAVYTDLDAVLTKAASTARMVHRFRISTPAKDRVGDVIVPGGCRDYLPRYKANPVVFFNHKSFDLPIGRSADPESGGLALELGDDYIDAAVFYHGKTAESLQVFELVQEGYLKGASIGFRPVEGRYLERDKPRVADGRAIDFEWAGLLFEKWELLEWSVVGIPCNQDAVRSILGKARVAGDPLHEAIRRHLESFREKATPAVTSGFETPPPAPTKPASKPVKAHAVPPSLLTREAAAGAQDPLAPLLLALPDVRQSDDYSCGACASMSVGRYFGVGPETLEAWKEALGTSVERSTHPKAIEDYLRTLGLEVEAKGDMSVADLRAAWLKGAPVICPVQDYGTEVDEEAEFEYGHYLAVVGVALEHVFCQDSSAENVTEGSGTIADKGRIIVSEKDWLENWHDRDADGAEYSRFGIVVYGPARVTTPAEPAAGTDAPDKGAELDRRIDERFEKSPIHNALVALHDDLKARAAEVDALQARLTAALKALPDASTDETEAADQNESPRKEPHGAKALRKHLKNLTCAMEHCAASAELVEHPKVGPAMKEMYTDLETMHDKAQKLAHKHYPEHFTDDGAAKSLPMAQGGGSGSNPPPPPPSPPPSLDPASAWSDPKWAEVFARIDAGLGAKDQALKDSLYRLTGKKFA